MTSSVSGPNWKQRFSLHEVDSKQNYFVDTVLGTFATKLGIMDAVVSVDWNDRDQSLLVHIRPPDPETYEEVKELTVDTLREIDSVRFEATCKQVDYRGMPSMVFKLKKTA
jgi:hypothetical protein